MAEKPTTIDEYLANVSEEQRTALERLRQIIRETVPDATECISYQIAAFRYHGMLVGFGATSKHCAFYLMSVATLEAHKEEVKGFDTGKGTIRFLPENPLPEPLVKKLILARMAENLS